MLRDRAVNFWAGSTGLALWVPAFALPGLPIPLQPLDCLVILGWPLILLHFRQIPVASGFVILSLVTSLALSFTMAKGDGLVFGHGVILAGGFVLLVAIAAGSPTAQHKFLRWFLLGAAGSAILFLLQLGFGAQMFDYRTNEAFSLPKQYGRGFALFPEVSTFATHAGMAFAVVAGLLAAQQVGPFSRRGLWALSILLLISLMFSRSTSFLVVTPFLCVFAIIQNRQVDAAGLFRLAAVAVVAGLVLYAFFNLLYVDRLETASATRSFSMRLASILGGLSPLWEGDIFGVGLGQNHEIQRRAYDMGRALDLSFGQLPQGVNSQIVSRIFEEGWPALINFAIGIALLVRSIGRRQKSSLEAALVTLAVGSFLTALMITGYRGIYSNWLWLALPAGLGVVMRGARLETKSPSAGAAHQLSATG